MSQLNVEKYKQEIIETWKDVVDNKTPTNWYDFDHCSKPVCVATG